MQKHKNTKQPTETLFVFPPVHQSVRRQPGQKVWKPLQDPPCDKFLLKTLLRRCLCRKSICNILLPEIRVHFVEISPGTLLHNLCACHLSAYPDLKIGLNFLFSVYLKIGLKFFWKRITAMHLGEWPYYVTESALNHQDKNGNLQCRCYWLSVVAFINEEQGKQKQICQGGVAPNLRILLTLFSSKNQYNRCEQ